MNESPPIDINHVSMHLVIIKFVSKIFADIEIVLQYNVTWMMNLKQISVNNLILYVCKNEKKTVRAQLKLSWIHAVRLYWLRNVKQITLFLLLTSYANKSGVKIEIPMTSCKLAQTCLFCPKKHRKLIFEMDFLGQFNICSSENKTLGFVLTKFRPIQRIFFSSDSCVNDSVYFMYMNPVDT